MQIKLYTSKQSSVSNAKLFFESPTLVKIRKEVCENTRIYIFTRARKWLAVKIMSSDQDLVYSIKQ